MHLAAHRHFGISPAAFRHWFRGYITGTWLRLQKPAPDQRTTYNKEDE